MMKDKDATVKNFKAKGLLAGMKFALDANEEEAAKRLLEEYLTIKMKMALDREEKE